jgi:pyridoxamine 5'-phosphate oxidase
MSAMNLADLRKDYTKGGLERSELAEDPMDQFQLWFDQALQAQVPEPNAMTLATTDASGKPTARIVLLKGVSPEGFRFFTNLESRKGQAIAQNGRVALLFYWAELERQIGVEGTISRLSTEEAEAYFHSRPRGNQLGAWASRQSTKVPDRESLEQAMVSMEKLYPGDSIPMPHYWGGFRVRPERIEFWQGRSSRLHDRFVYERGTTGWTISRLSP